MQSIGRFVRKCRIIRSLKVVEACAGEETEKELLQKEQEQGRAQNQER